MKPGRAALLVALAASIGATACLHPVPPDTFLETVREVDCCGRADAPVEFTYLGVGGWIIRKGGSAVLTAPLLSNPSLFDVGLTPIASDPDRIEAHLPDVSDVSAILAGHGHYDHLMDVPYIARRRATHALIYTNETSAHQLAPFGLGDRVRVVNDAAGTVEGPGEWLQVTPQVRIMPLLSDHAPHLAGITLYSGIRTRDMTHEPRSANEWLDGRTLAFLIDLLNADGSVGLRVYFQDAVPAPPLGQAPALADGVGVDVAILVPATYAEVSWHPEALLDNLAPRYVLLCHWEDFFQPPSQPPKPVPFTLLPDFVARLERALPQGAGWALPVAGARLVFH